MSGMRPLSAVLANMARKELNETPDRIEQDLKILRLWMQQQRHICANASDQLLIVFLRRCRYSLEATKRRIDNFYSSFTTFHEVMSNRLVNHRILEINGRGDHYFPEHPRCDNKNSLVISRPSAINYSRHSSRDVLRFYTMALEIIALENDYASVAGVSIIIDMKGFNVKSIHYTESHLNKKFWFWLTECAPLRINHVYFINVRPDYYLLFLFHSFLYRKPDIKVTLLKSQKELYKYFPKNCLPEEYGGTNGHIAECIRYMDYMLKQYRSYFEKMTVCGTIDRYRCGELTAYEADFGKDGSFRKINSD